MGTMCILSKTLRPTLKDCKGDIWFFTETDWSQECCHGNNIVDVILFLLGCTFLPSLKNTAPIFLEIFLIQYFIAQAKLFMTSSLSSYA